MKVDIVKYRDITRERLLVYLAENHADLGGFLEEIPLDQATFSSLLTGDRVPHKNTLLRINQWIREKVSEP